ARIHGSFNDKQTRQDSTGLDEVLAPRPSSHLPRHDLESLFYVMLWHTHRYEVGHLCDSSYEEWVTESVQQVRNPKLTLIHHDKPLSAPLPQHAKLQTLLSRYQRALTWRARMP
ncbi:hypothetical protein EIP91_010639, partial [Steccherinum ochraceum]